MMHIIKGMASDMNGFSDGISVELPDFHEAWERFEDSYTNLLSRLEIRTREDREQAVTLQGQMDTLREGMRQALAGAEEARGVFGALRGVSKDLNVAVRRVDKTLERVFEEFSIGESILVRTITLLDRKLQDS